MKRILGRHRAVACRRVAAALLVLVLGATGARAGGDWNDDGIAWRGLEDGLAEARQTGKPVCLVVYTDWCPHCTNYSRVFHDGEVEKQAAAFVMVRVEQDTHKADAARYAPDGTYVPRTVFLTSKGEIDPAIHAPRANYRYFYDEHDPGPLRAAMTRARAKLATKAGGS